MSSIGELTFFLGLQVKQKEDGIFISQDKYVAEILKKFDFASVKTASTQNETQNPLVKDEKHVMVTGTYLGPSPMTSHLNAVKRIFRHFVCSQCAEEADHSGMNVHGSYLGFRESLEKEIIDGVGGSWSQSSSDRALSGTDQAKEIKHMKAKIKKP
ncbi:hypothetical protein Tco_0206959 [Tanacetum coccineum]